VDRPAEPRTFETSTAFGEEPKAVEDEVLTGRVKLDNTRFERCRFRHAILVYAGGAPPLLRNCSFENASFEFAGPAGRTLALLQAMGSAKSGLRDIVKASFPRIYGN
jgi:uncharacterized protein YjbI with pentapeptide repeats